MRKVHDFLTVGAPAPLQQAGAVALEQGESYYPELRAMYEGKRDRLVIALREAGFICHKPEGAYYVMADFGDLGFDGDDTAFALNLIERAGVAPVPGSSFYDDAEAGSRFRALHVLEVGRNAGGGGAASGVALGVVSRLPGTLQYREELRLQVVFKKTLHLRNVNAPFKV